MGEAKEHLGMFGFFRFYLAICIVVGYAGPSHYPLFYQGVYASLLMAGYMNSRQFQRYYAGRRRGIPLFAFNRVLRYFPAYYALLPLGIFVAYKDSNASYSLFMTYEYIAPGVSPQAMWSWIANFSIIGLTSPSSELTVPTFIPHGWALNIGLLFSLLTPLLLRSRDTRVVVMFTSMYYSFVLAVLIVMDDSNDWLHMAQYGLYSGALPFMMGLYLYMLREKGRLRVSNRAGMVAMLVMAAFMLFPHDLGINPDNLGFWCVLLLSGVVVACLSHVQSQGFPYWLRAMDRFLSGVSYPMVVACVPVAAFIVWQCPEMYTTDENGFLTYNKPWELAQYTLPCTFILACVLYGVVEMPVAHLRARVRAMVGPKA